MVATFLNRQCCKVAFFLMLKYRSVAKHFISGLIRLFLFVRDVIASHTNSTTSLIPHDLAYI